MPIVPIRGCAHRAVRYEAPALEGGTSRRAECPTCHAVWIRDERDRWRCIDSGLDPSVAVGYRCPSCGMTYREQPRTCYVCGRPTRNDEDQPQLLDQLLEEEDANDAR